MNAEHSSSVAPLSRWRSLGPGLLWAGTAVGVSHLVQSTRAGAGYGLLLLWVVLAAHALKYPAFEAGARYTASTGRSLMDAYARQGRWVLWIFFLLTVSTMAIVAAAVTLVTAGMASVLLSDGLSAVTWSGLLLVFAVSVLWFGRYSVLDKVMKGLMLLLSVTTVAAVVALLPQTDWSSVSLAQGLPSPEPQHIAFMVAFVGWMPAPFDTSVWHSLWAKEQQKREGQQGLSAARFDFHVGYIGTAILACCFVFVGAAVLHQSGTPIPDKAPLFAKVLIDAYATALGSWARPVIMIASFATMLSTTLAVTDGFPRALAAASVKLKPSLGEERAYKASLLVVAAGALGLIMWMSGSFTGLLDFATTVSFVLTPVLAIFNYRAVTSEEVAPDDRPTGALLLMHWVCIAVMSVFSVGYVAWKMPGWLG